MSLLRLIICAAIFTFACYAMSLAQPLPREQWGAPAVNVSHTGGKWIITGNKNKVTLNESDLALGVQAGPADWAMVPSSAEDMLVKSRGEEFYLRLADARKIEIKPYDTGFKTGVKISLGEWRRNGSLDKSAELDLRIFLTVCLEGKDEELVFDTVANEGARGRSHVAQQWPRQSAAAQLAQGVSSNPHDHAGR
jgi:hypothetical protein